MKPENKNNDPNNKCNFGLKPHVSNNTFVTAPNRIKSTPLSFDFQEYHKKRLLNVSEWKNDGFNPYPHKFETTLTLPDFIAKYHHIQNGQKLPQDNVRVAGILSMRYSLI